MITGIVLLHQMNTYPNRVLVNNFLCFVCIPCCVCTALVKKFQPSCCCVVIFLAPCVVARLRCHCFSVMIHVL